MSSIASGGLKYSTTVYCKPFDLSIGDQDQPKNKPKQTEKKPVQRSLSKAIKLTIER